jgi:VanZ family protein
VRPEATDAGGDILQAVMHYVRRRQGLIMEPLPPSDPTSGSEHGAHIWPSETDPAANHSGQERPSITGDRRLGHGGLVLAIVTIGIVFGSLYPFDFRVPTEGIGPFHTLVESWAERPGRGDFLVNILLYMPFGMFAMIAQQHRSSFFWWLLVVIVAGGALSAAMELSQYFDAGRVTSATDVYANLLGTAIGAVAGTMFRFNSRFLLIDEALSNPIPTVLVMTWAAYRLYPYEPTIDLHKYWNALKPLILSPSLSAYDLYRYTVIWLTLFALIAVIAGERRGRVLAALFAGGILIAKVLIIDATLSVAEIVSLALALFLWPALAVSRRWRAALLVILLAGYVVAERLEPFNFLPSGRAFGWIPFASFLENGSLRVQMLSFFEKVFLYGSLLFLLTEAGLRLRLSALLVATCLLITSWLETHLPDRSAEITDAVMALLIAMIFALLRSDRPRRPSMAPPPTIAEGNSAGDLNP